MTNPASQQEASSKEGTVHTFSTEGRKLAAYYSSGDALRAKHAGATGDSGVNFPDWALGLVDVSGVRRALDAGSGWGRFAGALARRLTADATLMCSDMFRGMVNAARETLADAPTQREFFVADIEGLPIRAGVVDFAMANHVLYHLRDIGRGLRELGRVMGPGATFLATANADDIRIPIIDAHNETMRRLGIAVESSSKSKFALENGREVLGPWFDEVEEHVFEDTQASDPERLTATYLNTGRFRTVQQNDSLPEDLRERVPIVYRSVAAEMADADGRIELPILMVAYVCRGPRG